MAKPSVFVYVINVDWYFDLHWVQRARARLNSGDEVHIIMSQTDPEIFARLSGLGFVCHVWNIDRRSVNPFKSVLRLWDLYQLLKTIQPEIIHAITIKPNIFVGLIAHFLRMPFVLSVTGTGIIFSGKTLVIRIVRPIVRILYKLASTKTRRKLIFENYSDRDYFVETGLCSSEEAIAILGAGVDTDVFCQTPERHRDQPVILFAGRLLWDKGLGDLVEAGKLLRKQGLDFSIQVAGIIDHDTINAIDEKTLDQWHEQGLIERLGNVKNMPALLEEINIVVLPTYYGEGVPRILIEAGSCGRAVVTTNMPGCSEIVENQVNGLLVPPRNVEKLAEALAKLIRSPELREKMGQAGREKVTRFFSEQQVISETMKLYEGLLE
jgi:glycosyltransferase involved in cell wall biosynthesis